MSKILRRINKTPLYLQNKNENVPKLRFNNNKQKHETEMEEVWPVRRSKKRLQKKPNKFVSSRACNVSGSKDLTTLNNNQKIFVVKKSVHDCTEFPDNYDLISGLVQPQFVNRSQSPLKGSNSSPACILKKNKSLASLCTENYNNSNLYHLDSLEEIVPLIYKDQQEQATELKEASVQLDRITPLPKRIHISEVPRIKFIAEQYMRYQKNGLELRKLKEKIICIEYDVYDISEKCYNDQSAIDRYQVLRAFFSLKPRDENVLDRRDTCSLAQIPQSIKQKFQIADEDLKKLNEKEIQMIDSKIAENEPYLQDLKRILRSKQVRKLKDKPILDLQYLYEMAQRDCPLSDYKFSKLLTPNEMNEVKDIILSRGLSSVHGIRRRILKKLESRNENIISQSTIFQEIDV